MNIDELCDSLENRVRLATGWTTKAAIELEDKARAKELSDKRKQEDYFRGCNNVPI